MTEAAEKPRASRWEDSSENEVDPDDLLSEEQIGEWEEDRGGGGDDEGGWGYVYM